MPLIASSSSPNSTLELLDATKYPHARCLDGTQYGLYFLPASDNASTIDKSRWMIVLNGGGLCTHESDCTARSKTVLGSSSMFAPVYDMDTNALTSTVASSPFSDVNKVFMPYCSGDMHAGQRISADNSTFGLYFSGYLNIVGALQHLSDKYALNTSGNTLVWGGGSAGGVGVFSTLDHVAALLPSLRVVGAPVGGFPPEIEWSSIKGSTPPNEDVRTPAFAVNNQLFDAVLPTACVAALDSKLAYQCGVPHIAYPYLQTATFIMEALTDIVITCGFEGQPCTPPWKALLNPDNWHRWIQYGQNMTATLANTVMKSERDGVFAPSCLMHTGFTLDGPIIDGMNAVEALHAWMYPSSTSTSTSNNNNNNNNKHADVCKNGKYYPPCGKKCPPITKPMEKQQQKKSALGQW